jgi:hypothetical protein
MPNIISMMGQQLFQVKPKKSDKNWTRYSIFDDLTNKYKQLCYHTHDFQSAQTMCTPLQVK